MIKEILNVFTKEYREETKHMEFMQSHVNDFKLKTDSESVDDKIERLKNSERKWLLCIDINTQELHIFHFL